MTAACWNIYVTEKHFEIIRLALCRCGPYLTDISYFDLLLFLAFFSPFFLEEVEQGVKVLI